MLGFNTVHHRGNFGRGNYFAGHFPYSAQENFAKNKMHLCKSCGFLTRQFNVHCSCTTPNMSTVRELLHVAVDIGDNDDNNIMRHGDPREANAIDKFTRYDDSSTLDDYHSSERLRFYVVTTSDITTTGFVQMKPSSQEVVLVGIIYVEA
jgi:hypothetical protein